MLKNSLILRCYARPENDYILGVCLDLNLAVRGSSIEDVKQEMTKALTLHFKSLNKDNFKDLRYRPAPIEFWLDYYRVCFFVHLHTFGEKFHIFCEQIIPQNFSIIPCV